VRVDRSLAQDPDVFFAAHRLNNPDSKSLTLQVELKQKMETRREENEKHEKDDITRRGVDIVTKHLDQQSELCDLFLQQLSVAKL
jgi:hypothetical protein